LIEVACVITAAGRDHISYSRSGLKEPKNLILVGGRTILQRAIDSYHIQGSIGRVAILQSEVKEITSAGTSAAYPKATYVELPDELPGALITALFAVGGLDLDMPLIIAGGDSEIVGGVEPFFNAFIESRASAGTVVFEAKSSRWSYVDLDRNGHVNQVSEKQAIGEFATTGVFFFESISSFLEAAEWCLVNKITTDGLFYVSSTLNYLISQGKSVSCSRIPREMYVSYSRFTDLEMQES
jgi:hypothetical protein